MLAVLANTVRWQTAATQVAFGTVLASVAKKSGTRTLMSACTTASQMYSASVQGATTNDYLTVSYYGGSWRCIRNIGCLLRRTVASRGDPSALRNGFSPQQNP